MISSFHAFKQAIQKRDHVFHLINKIDHLTIRLISTECSFSFSIAEGKLFILEEEDEQEKSIVLIYGDTRAIKELLEGKAKLRLLVEQEQLKVTASFRMILLLESLFFLTKAAEMQIKIN